MDATNFKIATHNGRITVKNPATGDHRTFRIRTQADDSTFAPGERIVALLTGPDNGTDYQQFGFVKPDGSVILWKKFRNNPLWGTYVNMLRHPQWWTENRNLQYLYEGRCRRCNRALTDPTSIETGIGPVCGGREAGGSDESGWEPAGDEVWE